MLEEKNDNLSAIENAIDGDVAQTQTIESQTEIEDATSTLENLELNNQETVNDELNPVQETEENVVFPTLDYENLTVETLISELEKLVSHPNIMQVRTQVEEIKNSFLNKFNHLLEEKRNQFYAENPETTQDFYFDFPLKAQFDILYTQYRDQKNLHFKSLENNQKSNLENRLAIIEELKELINPQENIKDVLKTFNELRDRWKNAGPIPKDKYNHVWNNYHFHLENFYDYLHLDREARDLDFKHNLDQKLKIIARVEALTQEEDNNKAFRELQDLHKIWKEDIGPVSKEFRDDIWNKFSELTKIIHDKRDAYFDNLRKIEVDNLERKKEIIAQIEALATEKVEQHNQWQVQVEKVETLRKMFFETGKVPSDVNEEVWDTFKNAVRNFNTFKNSFYKDIKKEQQENLNKKMELVAKAKALQESEDFAATTPIMKQIQEDWKLIGHVPKKYSDTIWKEFKESCNHYFDKLKEKRNEANSEEVEAFEKKKAYLESLKDFELTGDHKTDLDAIKAHIANWKSFGKVPFARRHVEGKFNKILDALFDKLSLSKKDSEMARFTNRMEQLNSMDDTRKLENEKIFLTRKIEEVQSEIFQLENNIQFFANAKKDNPLVLEVLKSIDRHKEDLEMWKEKLKQFNSMKKD